MTSLLIALSMELAQEQAYLSGKVRNPFYGRPQLSSLTAGSYCRVDRSGQECGYQTKEYCKLSINDLRDETATCERASE